MKSHAIILIVLLVAVALDGVTAFISVSAPSTVSQNACDGVLRSYGRCEEGSSSCSIPIGSISCVKIITFTTAFTNAPDINPVTKYSGNTAPVTIIAQSATSFFALESAGQTWTSMPVAQTEIFGDASQQHWISMDLSGSGGSPMIAFFFNCQVGSSSGNAMIQPQWSTNLGVTWNNITAGINFGLTGCPSPAVLGFQTPYVPIPALAQTTSTELRLIGWGGNGVGDNPVFNIAYMMVQKTLTIAPVVTCIDRGISSPTIRMQIGCFVTVTQPATVTATFNWQAWSYTG